MSKIYNIDSTRDNRVREYRPFDMLDDIQNNDTIHEYSSYNEILRILKEAFKLIDFNNIIKK